MESNSVEDEWNTTNVTTEGWMANRIKASSDQKYWAQLIDVLGVAATDKCVDCNRELGGLFGSFRWAIQNGVGECSKCGFPYLYYHRFECEGERIVLMAYVPLAEMPLKDEREPCAHCGLQGCICHIEAEVTRDYPG